MCCNKPIFHTLLKNKTWLLTKILCFLTVLDVHYENPTLLPCCSSSSEVQRGCWWSIPVRGVPAEPESIPSRSWVPIPPPQHPLRTLPRRQEHPLKQTNPTQGQLHRASLERGCDALPRVIRPAEVLSSFPKPSLCGWKLGVVWKPVT